MANDDWRIRIQFGEDDADNFLERLTHADARELAEELKDDRLVVSRDGDNVFVYAGSKAQAEAALKLVQKELEENDLHPEWIVIEHWLAEEDRWDDEPEGPDIEEETVARGYAPWEVRVELKSHDEAEKLADQLEQEGHAVVRRWKYVIVGAASKEEAEELAKRLHGEVEPGGELVYEVARQNPFAVLGGLGGTGTPL